MSDLSIRLGGEARIALCDAFDSARSSIDAEFFSLHDDAVVESLNRAADRGVRVHVTLEGDPQRYRGAHAKEPAPDDLRNGLDSNVDVVVSQAPNELVHGKAAVVDGRIALVATANIRASGFDSPGQILVVDENAGDVRAVAAKIELPALHATPGSGLRSALDALMRSSGDLTIASEDLSDPEVVGYLIHRAHRGHRDRILVNAHPSKTSASALAELEAFGVAVHVLPFGFMHEKYIDAGERIYIGSANLTRNGIDEAYEIGIIANQSEFDDRAAGLRKYFDGLWAASRPWGRRDPA